MKAAGLNIIDQAPRKGSRGTTVFFVHPKAFGYLVEVVEEGRR
jgi:methylmalonyl-CoA/ethylmalonyl-CoA epimerase